MAASNWLLSAKFTPIMFHKAVRDFGFAGLCDAGSTKEWTMEQEAASLRRPLETGGVAQAISIVVSD
ncbi:hypothetical protein VTN77DRAFT_4128 [Rasamsonia byssochlamydoides]|uniref:uncharacterized protein n=1 Tax=Rasamsonia byssochlamydoides TaxID=89139 RepID=UPI0037436177